jgi:hypothetical protein
MAHLLIVAGSDAGISAALRAREVDPSIDVTLVVADSFPNYSICGLPFYLSGEVADWRDLAHRTRAEIEGQGIDLLLNHTARDIDAERLQVIVRDANGPERALQKRGQKAPAFKRGMNGLSPAGDECPTRIAIFARLRRNRDIGTLHLTNHIVFAGSTVNRSRG